MTPLSTDDYGDSNLGAWVDDSGGFVCIRGDVRHELVSRGETSSRLSAPCPLQQNIPYVALRGTTVLTYFDVCVLLMVVVRHSPFVPD